MGTESEAGKVTVDDRGRITLPKSVRERLRLGEGDDLDVTVEGGAIVLRPDREAFEPIESGKNEWGDEAFLDAGEAMVGEPESETASDGE